ncbi:MAG: RraA family protein [Oricola sp.]
MRKILDKLAAFDSCTLSDAMDALSLPAAISGIERFSGEGRLAGKVKTVLLREGAAPVDGPKVHLGARAIVEADDETVILVSHPGIDAGGWGGVLTQAARIAGVRGVVVDGPTRDVDEARDIGFPIFARKATPRTARGRVHEIATGVPVKIADVPVDDGDYLVADSTGVAIIPRAWAEDVLAKANLIAAREAGMLDALRKKTPVIHVMGANYETMLENKE